MPEAKAYILYFDRIFDVKLLINLFKARWRNLQSGHNLMYKDC